MGGLCNNLEVWEHPGTSLAGRGIRRFFEVKVAEPCDWNRAPINCLGGNFSALFISHGSATSELPTTSRAADGIDNSAVCRWSALESISNYAGVGTEVWESDAWHSPS